MAFEIDKVDVWVAEMSDRPRALMKKLEVLTEAGANLEFVIARPAKRGKAIVSATTHWQDYGVIAEYSHGLGDAMKGIEALSIPEEHQLQTR